MRRRQFENESLVPPAGFVPEGNAGDLRFRAGCWSSQEVLSFRNSMGALATRGGRVIPNICLAVPTKRSSIRLLSAIYPFSTWGCSGEAAIGRISPRRSRSSNRWAGKPAVGGFDSRPPPLALRRSRKPGANVDSRPARRASRFLRGQRLTRACTGVDLLVTRGWLRGGEGDLLEDLGGQGGPSAAPRAGWGDPAARGVSEEEYVRVVGVLVGW